MPIDPGRQPVTPKPADVGVSPTTPIAWTDDTLNLWAGCTKVSEACKHCYAEESTGKKGFVDWGPKAERRLIESWPAKVRKSERAAIKPGAVSVSGVRGRRLVFVNSWSDFFDDRPEVAATRARFYDGLPEWPHLDFLLLTKRPENIARLIPEAWARDGWPPNVWLGVTVENQARAEQRIPILVQHGERAAVRFLSVEPMLGPIDLSPWLDRLDWVICGGESDGHGRARPMQVQWARDLRDQCVAAGVPFFFKQWGNHEQTADGGEQLVKLRVKRHGPALLDGVEHKVWPVPRGATAATAATTATTATEGVTITPSTPTTALEEWAKRVRKEEKTSAGRVFYIADLIAAALDDTKATQAAFAKAIGRSLAYVKKYVALAKVPAARREPVERLSDGTFNGVWRECFPPAPRLPAVRTPKPGVVHTVATAFAPEETIESLGFAA